MQGSFRSSSRLITREVSLTLQVIASVSIAAGGIILRVSLIPERSMLNAQNVAGNSLHDQMAARP